MRHLTVAGGLTAVALLTTCRSPDATGPDREITGPLSLSIAGGNGQAGVVSQELPTPLSVLVTDVSSTPVPNYLVNFVVASGGGSVYAGSSLTDGNGIAKDYWTLGSNLTAPDTVQVRAVDPTTGTKYLFATFTATKTAAPSATIKVNAGDNQSGVINSVVPTAPAAVVRDKFGNPKSGVTVTFTIGSGAGTITGGVKITDVNGIATIGSWKLGAAAGTNTLTASTGGTVPVAFTATSVTSGYNIIFRYLSTLTAPQTKAFTDGGLRWRSVITADLPSMAVNLPAGSCLPAQPAINETVDDIVIYVELTPIDGAAGVLARAGPCVVRTTGKLPAIGIMQFDDADVASLEGNGTFDEVVLHEMGHVLGFGSIWTDLNLLSSGGTTDPFFKGTNAVNSFPSIGGYIYPGHPVPVENTGGTGTADAHWRESVFKDELMTGFLTGTIIPMSIVTVSSMRDLGYKVNTLAAQPFSILPALQGGAALLRTQSLAGDVWHGPRFEVDRAGQVTRLAPR